VEISGVHLDCRNCRYVPFVARKILRRQENFIFGEKPEA
jgi:hypothetical protein